MPDKKREKEDVDTLSECVNKSMNILATSTFKHPKVVVPNSIVVMSITLHLLLDK
jgi:hypothetical protein